MIVADVAGELGHVTKRGFGKEALGHFGFGLLPLEAHFFDADCRKITHKVDNFLSSRGVHGGTHVDVKQFSQSESATEKKEVDREREKKQNKQKRERRETRTKITRRTSPH